MDLNTILLGGILVSIGFLVAFIVAVLFNQRELNINFKNFVASNVDLRSILYARSNNFQRKPYNNNYKKPFNPKPLGNNP